MRQDSQLNRSYFYAIDDRFGYGNISYFTFLSEFNRSWKHAGDLEAGIMISLFVLSVFGNSVIIVFLIKIKKSRTITNYFVCNLAVADLMFALSAPFVSHVRMTSHWNIGEVMCGFLNYGMFVCATVMIWTMTAISIDRYRCINKLMSANDRLKPWQVAIICMGIWIISACIYLPIALFFHVKSVRLDQETICFCTLLWPNSSVRYSLLFTVLVLVFGFVVPLLIISVNYYRILHKLWSSKRAIGHARTESIKRKRNSVKTRELKIVKTLVLLVLLFIVMWLPLFITFGLIQHDVSVSANNISSSVLVGTLIIAYVNPCVNPFLYGFINKEIYKALTFCCKRNKVDSSDSDSRSPVSRRTAEQEEVMTTHM